MAVLRHEFFCSLGRMRIALYIAIFYCLVSSLGAIAPTVHHIYIYVCVCVCVCVCACTLLEALGSSVSLAATTLCNVPIILARITTSSSARGWPARCSCVSIGCCLDDC
ncbi:ubiquitin-fold modifier 1 [Iris pallida]|uniref:Ubiquitin-fold modifier 1 n=1 Tax=Iris pallida TaxID=29817 RepID=A0AAX6GBU2_IRIPA|nr:ubiquitin-fold modifier 1 [Iris pallida]